MQPFKCTVLIINASVRGDEEVLPSCAVDADAVERAIIARSTYSNTPGYLSALFGVPPIRTCPATSLRFFRLKFSSLQICLHP